MEEVRLLNRTKFSSLVSKGGRKMDHGGKKKKGMKKKSAKKGMMKKKGMKKKGAYGR